MDEKCKFIVKKGGQIGLLVYFLKSFRFTLSYINIYTGYKRTEAYIWCGDCLKVGINKFKIVWD